MLYTPNRFGISPKLKNPEIPKDAISHVVGYDPDINLKYRVEKLKYLHLGEGAKGHEARIRQLDDAGQLDVVRLGDQVFFQNLNFIPVKLEHSTFTYYLVHTMDILTIKKIFHRDYLENPNKYKKPVEEKKLKVV